MRRTRAIALATIRRVALALPEATESRHFDIPDIRVRNKIVLSFPKGEEIVGLKCTPENVDALVTADGETFKDLWGGRWLGVRLDRVSQPVVQDLIADAWCLAAPKRMVATWRESANQTAIPTVKEYGGRFKAKLFRYPGAGGWTFVVVPVRAAPRVTHAWGRTPVQPLSMAMHGRRASGGARTGARCSRFPSACAAPRLTETP